VRVGLKLYVESVMSFTRRTFTSTLVPAPIRITGVNVLLSYLCYKVSNTDGKSRTNAQKMRLSGYQQQMKPFLTHCDVSVSGFSHLHNG